MNKGPWPARVLLFIAALMGGSCVSLEQAAPPVAMLPASACSGPVGQLEHGREIYLTKCAKCHRVEPILHFPREKWVHEILPEMSEETKLNADETAAVRAYVMSVLGG